MKVPNIGPFQALLCRFGWHRRGRLRDSSAEFQRARCRGCDQNMIRKPGQEWRLATPADFRTPAQVEPDAVPVPKPIEWPKRALDPRPPAKPKSARRAKGAAKTGAATTGAATPRPKRPPRPRKAESAKPE
jgi:hypothetical protein